MIKQLQDTDIHLLRVFVAVAESGGFSAAQERLNVAASTISTQISNLETRLGFRLCNRGRAGFSLTSQGEIVLQSAYQLMKDLGTFVSRVEATHDDLIGNIKIALIDNTLSNPKSKASEVLNRLRENYPYLQFEMRQCSPSMIEHALIKREIDVGLSWFSSKAPSLTYYPLFNEEHAICCGKHHPLYDCDDSSIDASLLEATDWVSRSYALPRSFHYASPPISSAVSDNMEGIAHFVLAGTHVGYLPVNYAQKWIEDGQIRRILPDSYNYVVEMNLAVRTESKEDNRVKAVVDAFLSTHKYTP